MHDGRVEQIGAPLDLYDRPANLFVAGFIGSPAMNFIKGRLDTEGFATDGGLRLPVATAPDASDGRSVIYGVRPQHFQLTSTGVPIEVVVIEPTRSETQVVAKAHGQELICVFRERINARPGEVIHVQPKASLVHLFDPETGLRLGSSVGRAERRGDRASSILETVA
jgi:multiple sugar transport system ATP-binding protein